MVGFKPMTFCLQVMCSTTECFPAFATDCRTLMDVDCFSDNWKRLECNLTKLDKSADVCQNVVVIIEHIE